METHHHDHCRHHHSWNPARIAAMAVGGIVIAGLIALAFGWLVMLLWNWLMPAIFGLGAITYWQGFGLALLSKLLFGGIRSHHRVPHHPHGPRPWRHAMHNDWAPGGDRRNWVYYRDYWKEQGLADFEAYLKKMHTSEGDNKENNS